VFSIYFNLGIDHIADINAYDHIVFLLILCGVYMFRQWRELLVLIPSKDRLTACISSQVGCGMACTFCATGSLGFTRNLSAGEITDQLFAIDQIGLENYGKTVGNVVYMGMGEPLQNYKNVMKSVKRLTDPKGHGMAPSRITVSTSGLTKQIRQLADDDFNCHLAISLHIPDDATRTRVMPVNEGNNLDILSDALAYYYEKTHDRISIEYTLLDGVNDSIEDASKLGYFTKRFPVKINIIEYNPHDASPYKAASSQNMDAFVRFLQGLNLIVNVRHSKGKDIDAACGQLAAKKK
jgi:23S rRNA (adenine2503-C2)-methyltransferase